MVFAIITHVPHGQRDNQYFAYSPYVREMNIWTKFVDEVIIVAPLEALNQSAIHLAYDHSKVHFCKIPAIDLLRFKAIVKAVFATPKIAFQVYKAMKKADHIHLRCPGNIGLIACFIQILFPKKIKTAKYAGNWDPKAKQPLSYNIQKWILSNTFLTKKIKVLVYGEWQNTSINIKPFFTASYYEKDKIKVVPRELLGRIKFLFVGTLSPGKRPLYALQLMQKLKALHFDVQLSILGEGKERKEIENYVLEHKLNEFIFLEGNQNHEEVKKAYQENHFVVLPSKSEGWPKVIAEGMFWGCLPIATQVSCVGNILDNGKRGLILKMDLDEDVEMISAIVKSQSEYNSKVEESISWSRKYTIDLFENEIRALLHS
jgi:glycosyltransferase involved in cell wall biosynthesis